MSTTIFLLHHAGGSGHSYLTWRRHAPEQIRMCPVSLPGRLGTRPDEPCRSIDEAAALVAETVAAETNPVALFGHSMGALVAYEATRVLEDAGRSPEATSNVVADPYRHAATASRSPGNTGALNRPSSSVRSAG